MKHAMRTSLFLAAGALITMGGFVRAQDSTTQTTPGQAGGNTANAQDKSFMQAAENSNLAEIATSKLALNKATKQPLKDFAQKMIDDHTKAEDELKQLASSKKVTLKGQTDPQNKAALAKLTKLSGAAFDSTYSKVQKDGHDKTITAFQKEISGGADSDVKGYAQKYLPAIQDHDKMITDMKAMKSSGKMGKMDKMSK